MRTSDAIGAAILGFSVLSGCIDQTGGSMAPAAPAGNEPEAAARGACLRDVRRATGNSDVVVTGSSFSQAGTEVLLRVGPSGSWRCIAYRDGTTADIRSLTDEGAL